MIEYYVLTRSSYYVPVMNWLIRHQIPYELHLNRTRFSIDPHTIQGTEFALRWLEFCGIVADSDSDTLYLPR
jgi:hypothetical protein